MSDNEAYNRLFDFLGPVHINSKMREKGLAPVRISQKLSVFSLDSLTRQMIFNPGKGQYKLPVMPIRPPDPLDIYDIEKGRAYIKNGEKIEGPFSFAYKNYFPLETQHNLMKRLFFPANFEQTETFNIDLADMEFLKNAMSSVPKDLGYDEAKYHDSYGKFFLYGDSKTAIPKHLKIYNKVGYAYGTLTETAYIVDEKNGVEFLLSATLLVNENQIFNDDEYEYGSMGIPFLAELGRQIYQQELAAKK